MNSESKIYLSIIFLVYALFILFAFTMPEQPIWILYILFPLVYITPMLVHGKIHDHEYYIFILLISTLLGFLIVIDPVEIGLFGHDPYRMTSHWNEFKISGSISFTDEGPMLFLLSESVLQITGISNIVQVAKYVPLVSVLVPICSYIILKDIVSQQISLIGSLTVASIQELLIFESKFVPEALAVTLFYTFVFLLYRNRKSHQNRFEFGLLTLILIISIAFAHSFTSGIMVLFLTSYLIASILTRVAAETFSSTGIFVSFRGDSRKNISRLSILAGIATILVTSLFIYANIDLTGALLTRLITAINGQEATGATVSSALTQTSLSATQQLIKYGNYVFLLLFGLLNAVYFFKGKKISTFERGSIIFSGVLSLGFLLILLIGTVIPIHSSRFPVFLYPPLLIISIIYLCESGYIKKDHITLVVVLFVLVQTTTFPPHILQTDKSSTKITEGHYTSQLREASDWSSNYVPTSVIGWEGELWENVSQSDFVRYGTYRVPLVCDNSWLIIRDSVESNIHTEYEKLNNNKNQTKSYTNGNVSIISCTT